MSELGRCRGCDARFRGKQNHCGVCHQTFATESGGDSHRTGPFNPPGKRGCMLSEALTAGGMWAEPNANGTLVWHGVWSKSGKDQRRLPTTYRRSDAPRPRPGAGSPPPRRRH